MTELLKIKDLTKNYKNFSLCNVSFGIEPGKITGLIGINGAGKTTVIKCIGQLEQPDSGELYFSGEKLGISPVINEKIGYVLDSSYFYENLSIRNMTKVIAASYINWDWAVFQAYCDRFHLDVHMKIETLSKGMKMKYALALALLLPSTL